MTSLLGFECRANNGARTRDPQLGKLMLYQLSYIRNSDCKIKKILDNARKIPSSYF